MAQNDGILQSVGACIARPWVVEDAAPLQSANQIYIVQILRNDTEVVPYTYPIYVVLYEILSEAQNDKTGKPHRKTASKNTAKKILYMHTTYGIII